MRADVLVRVGPERVPAANNYAESLRDLQRFEEAKSLLRKIMPVARRFLGESNVITIRMRSNYAIVSFNADVLHVRPQRRHRRVEPRG